MKKRVLIVEDDITLEPFWMAVVKKAEPRSDITWVVSEKDAEREIRHSLKKKMPFDLIVIDLFLAGPQTGIDLWEIAGEQLRSRMILTSGMNPDKFNRYFGDHASAPPFLQKPYSMTECVETIRWMMGTGQNKESQNSNLSPATTLA